MKTLAIGAALALSFASFLPTGGKDPVTPGDPPAPYGPHGYPRGGNGTAEVCRTGCSQSGGSP